MLRHRSTSSSGANGAIDALMAPHAGLRGRLQPWSHEHFSSSADGEAVAEARAQGSHVSSSSIEYKGAGGVSSPPDAPKVAAEPATRNDSHAIGFGSPFLLRPVEGSSTASGRHTQRGSLRKVLSDGALPLGSAVYSDDEDDDATAKHGSNRDDGGRGDLSRAGTVGAAAPTASVEGTRKLSSRSNRGSGPMVLQDDQLGSSLDEPDVLGSFGLARQTCSSFLLPARTGPSRSSRVSGVALSGSLPASASAASTTLLSSQALIDSPSQAKAPTSTSHSHDMDTTGPLDQSFFSASVASDRQNTGR